MTKGGSCSGFDVATETAGATLMHFMRRLMSVKDPIKYTPQFRRAPPLLFCIYFQIIPPAHPLPFFNASKSAWILEN